MKPLLIVLACLLVLLGLRLGMDPLSAGAPGKSPEAAAYKYVYIHDSCAPWDGAAIRILLQTKPFPPEKPHVYPVNAYPSYILNVWPDDPELRSGRWLPLEGGSNSDRHGMASWCPKKEQCQHAEGKVRLFKLTRDYIEGEASLQTPDGKTILLPFKGIIRATMQMCG